MMVPSGHQGFLGVRFLRVGLFLDGLGHHRFEVVCGSAGNSRW
jgi:hypothetical protein